MSNHDKELTDREYIPLCVLNTFFALTAIVLNSVAIHAIRKTTSAFLPTNVRVLLLNLAFSDLSVGLVVQPIYIINLTFRSKSTQQGENLEKLNPLSLVTGMFFVSASILAVLALSVDRFLAVHLHLRYQEIVTSKRVIFILILFWVISAIISLLGGIGYDNVRLISISILLAFCLITIALLQCKIYSVVRRHRYEIRAQKVQGSEQNDSTTEPFKRQKPSIYSAFLIYLLLLICYLPHFLTDFAYSISKERIRIIHRYTATLLLFNSCLNPLIYCWKFRHIRPTIRTILRNIFCQGHAQL